MCMGRRDIGMKVFRGVCIDMSGAWDGLAVFEYVWKCLIEVFFF